MRVKIQRPRPLSRSKEMIGYVQKNVEEYISTPNVSSRHISTVTNEFVRTVEDTKLCDCDHCSKTFFSSAGLGKHNQVYKGKSDTF